MKKHLPAIPAILPAIPAVPAVHPAILPLLRLLPLLLFGSCHMNAHKVSDDILDSFKKVNTSITEANNKLSARNALVSCNMEIQSKSDNNKTLATKAQNLYTTIQQADSLLATIKQTLLQKDPSGDNTGIAEQLLVHTSMGEDLKAASLHVSDFCHAAIVNPATKKPLDSLLQRAAYIKYHPDWQEEYFKGTPTVAALTILAAFQSDFMKAGALIMKDIHDHLR